MRPVYLGILSGSLLLCLGIAACSNATPDPPAVSFVTETQITIPTVALPTARPPATPAPPTPTGTLVVQPTATPTLVPGPFVYLVQEADTLSGLALRFNLTPEELAVANGLNPNDFLQANQSLIIPVPGQAISAATTPTQIDAALPPAPAESGTSPEEGPAELAPRGADSSEATAAAPLVPLPPPPPPVPSGPQPPLAVHGTNINPLTGLAVDNPTRLQRRPLLVRIGNDVGARASQAGLNSADIVYEELTEWYITRFTAIFLANTPSLVAPIRSARLINVQLAPQYGGALAHSGGSDPVRWEISQAPIANLDEFYHPAPYFYRPNAGWQTRLGLDTVAARAYMASHNLEASVKPAGFFFQDSLDRGEPAPNIYIPYPRATCFTQWSYDPAAGRYLRWINGSPLYDVSGGQVAAANVVVYFAEHRETNIVEDSNGATSIRIIVNGRGPAWFFRDGRLNRGFWQTDGTRPPYFSYTDGSPYPLKPGNTWVEVVPTYYQIGLNSAAEANSQP